MKKLFRKLFCTMGLALMLSTSVLAAEASDMLLIAPAPSPSAISIELNGQPLTFTDAVPQIVNGRTYLPFRTVFTALGFADEDITFDGETRTVSAASEELTVSMVIGENKVSVTKQGETTVLDTDVPAFIDPAVSRTYVPARFVAEAADYRVGWNGDTRTVIIDDVDAILEANQETYQVLDLYLDYARKFQEKNYQVEGSYAADMTIAQDVMELDGTYSMLMADGSKFDFEMLMELAGTVEGEDLSAAVPEGIDVELRGDMENGVFCFKSDALMTMMETGIENMWFRLDLGTMMDSVAAETGMGYAELMMSQETMADMDGEAYVDYVVGMMANTDPTTSVVDYLAMYNAMLGDSAFTKSGRNYVAETELEGMSMTMTIPTSGGKASGYAIALAGQDEGVEMLMEISMDGKKMEAVIKMVMEDMTIEMTMDGTYTATSKKPVGQPGEEAAVMDLMEMLGAYEGLPAEPAA